MLNVDALLCMLDQWVKSCDLKHDVQGLNQSESIRE